MKDNNIHTKSPITHLNMKYFYIILFSLFASYSNAQITLEAVVKNDILIVQTSYKGLALKQDGEDSTYYIRFDQSGAIPYIRDSDPEKYNYYPFNLYLGKTKEIAANTFTQLIRLIEVLKENEKALFKDCNNQQFIIYRVQATGNKKRRESKTAFKIRALDVKLINNFNVQKGYAVCSFWTNQYLIDLKDAWLK